MALSGFGTRINNSLAGAARSLWNDLTGSQIELFFKDSEQTSFDFGLKSNYYLDGFPRFKFQYFAKIKFNQDAYDTDGEPFCAKYLNDDEVAMLVPLTSYVDMPSMSIETTKLNQYNHPRFVQTKINYQPVTMEMHDVVDGKSLRFWEMYNEYYFKDNIVLNERALETVSVSEKKEQNAIVEFILGEKNTVGPKDINSKARKLAYNFMSDQATKENSDFMLSTEVIADSLSFYTNDVSDPATTFNNNFGYNLETVGDEKHLIDYIEIYQYHAGRWSMVRLMRPFIKEFKHDRLSYSETTETMKMTYTFEYEYALYHNFYTPFDQPQESDGLFTPWKELGKDIKNFFTGSDPAEEEDPTWAKEIFKNTNYLDIAGASANTSNFSVRPRTLGETSTLAETAGELRNTSLLGNLFNDVADVLASGPDKIGDSVTKFATTGKWEQPFDSGAIGKSFSNKASQGLKTIKSKNLGSAAKKSSGAVFDIRRR